MKKTSVISICGIFAALSVVIMLIGYFPVLTYALPAIAGSLLILINIEFSAKSAVCVYLVVSIISFIACEKETTLCYALFFGYYPILKAYIERIKSKLLQMVTKIVVFTLSFVIIYVIAWFVFGIPFEEMGIYGVVGIIALVFAFELMFVVYDFALTRVISLYFYRYQDKFRKLLKIKNKK